MTNLAPLHVVAGVVRNAQGDILLARRHPTKEHGDLWEFPGGKREVGEQPEETLVREFKEEVDITIQRAHPLIRIRHTYTHREVLLDVWSVEQFSGKAWGREGQPIEWCAPHLLRTKTFPAANYPVITAALLPAVYLITAEPLKRNDPKFFYQLERNLEQGIQLLQFRSSFLDAHEYCYCAEKILTICEPYKVQVLAYTTPAIALSVGVHGVHLQQADLLQLVERPLKKDLWVAASCHTPDDIKQAQTIDLDFVTLSPIRATSNALGWLTFFTQTEQAKIPVFASGGLQYQDIGFAWAHGGQGIAGQKKIWDSTMHPIN
ncbi:Nudix family hydrolase [Beggiatoa leptomitoformis]|uniref:8-oxo-dGTP diphosphatase n=1 Tax=Beggiatoa leptomitoformis TaxID=288004 RepID=A0A2N9YA24_9GAMM|nr:Nudix family hydrolase [Beggiatoa leptomitoformis]ALG67264.1 Nudix family hydrolase [Beggiatoa leptomitoformis]AUI67311.1 Nudix family hydrolase [Beggiatoa leptomitoformis]